MPEARDKLRADCARCAGLCCVVPAFAKSADFAIDKPAGEPCSNLRPDSGCGIHDQLRERGFPGCTVYDCFGAGQQVVQVTFGGRSWRSSPEAAAPMFATFTIMRQLHELLWHLNEALMLSAAAPLHDRIGTAYAEIAQLTEETPELLADLDLADRRHDADGLLSRASELARAGTRRRDHRGADLIGKKLRGADLTGANLRSAYLIGADLRGANLDRADLIGADLRGTDLRGADLATSIFLTQSQADAAVGDATTRLPPSLTHPSHWPTR